VVWVLITFSILAYVNWRRFHDFLYPGFLQVGVWLFALGILAFTRQDFDPVHNLTWTTLVAGAMSFTAGCAATTLGHEPVLERQWVRSDVQPGVWRQWLVFLLPLLLLPLFVREARAIGASAMDDNLLVGVRDQLGSEEASFGAYGYAMRLAFLAAGVAALHRFGSGTKQRLKTLLLVGTTAVSLVYAVLFTGRNFVVFLAFIVAGVPLILRAVRPVRAGAALLAGGMALFACYAVHLHHGGISEQSSTDETSNVVVQLGSLYIAGPIVALDRAITETHFWDWGINSFRNLVLWINRLGYDIPLRPIAKDFVPVMTSGWETNIYTLYHPLYLDFGLLGVIMFQLLAGSWHGYLYRRATVRQPEGAYVLLYAVFLLPLLMQFEVDYYLAIMVQWAFFYGIVKLLYAFTPRPTSAEAR